MPMNQHRGWLPKDPQVLRKWIHAKILQLHRAPVSAPDQYSHPVIAEFHTLIRDDPQAFMYFTQMSNDEPVGKDGHKNVTDWKMMLCLFDTIIAESIEYHSDQGGQVTVPMNAVINSFMNTQAGMAAFLYPKINDHFFKVLKVWSNYLASPASRSVLTTNLNGWFSPEAQEERPDFADVFVCDTSKEFWGFTSWDDFFTRRLRDNVFPVFPDDTRFISNPCESTVYNKGYNVKEQDKFWIKGQPYSLFHMLNNDPLANQFVGGTVYQAYLSPTDYHRWHSPVTGLIAKTVVVPGTYFAAVPDDKEGDVLFRSLDFITAVATRALIFVQSDNPEIGLVCFIAVGMGEVSSCEVTVKEGEGIRKGDQMGMFHFGGSSCCLVFRPETKITFTDEADDGKAVRVNLGIACVAN
ncbi:hypothetical protein SERLA73DRAFT_153679 [Serpula lacrymans var. lacrymans S7.3]|uniref:L-tryptophan decarboxylase PsiD-like domain-containing protein n=2 Tax=Serpula lacrymans var. lacrymans TaxID=341189 RepID=F8Q1Y0_SERL3|nr:uncharacterized protein SERLADRAFT_409365 [Serpula lacrymans var. lacrymans S7.9]EGN97191.1 hypothetical protein SERLA73DRAFT_153679 [Serpula lacrymans var. lacrymans S7.3]EGO22799.1 hypothetical protein SERLADRAFT_409365 [Serpula lacrymans var. lacrymans S7.9]